MIVKGEAMTTRRNACRLILAALVSGAAVTAVTAQRVDRSNRTAGARGERAPRQPRPTGGGGGGMNRQRYHAGRGSDRRQNWTVNSSGDMNFNPNQAFGQKTAYRPQGARGYGGRGAGNFRARGQY